jgi:hypothetical protein
MDRWMTAAKSENMDEIIGGQWPPCRGWGHGGGQDCTAKDASDGAWPRQEVLFWFFFGSTGSFVLVGQVYSAT